ncbi:PLDc N-terminal domain-containing protein [Microbacterium flavescens]|uniref:PLDc N-terminal domain-containing protein n=1 Tax=Microbacterium flavescens TaxID=69366 RepID=UPI001BDF0CE5|nr:PLDc N-terminal domain-containing protein [Microbacterium flavescens]BFF11333.1 hypothetical protein GCM10025699_26360 [Microbacterium flavescens]
MTVEHNPLIPAAYDVVWSVVALLIIVLTIVALVTLSRLAKRLTSAQALVWTLVVLFVPLVGPSVWLSIGRRAVPAHPV